eukprot:m.181435 g.181435  ORF g.181435 m.181435 type:complete len:208 (+) comp25454_c1_seq4:1517-2140(+)
MCLHENILLVSNLSTAFFRALRICCRQFITTYFVDCTQDHAFDCELSVVHLDESDQATFAALQILSKKRRCVRLSSVLFCATSAAALDLLKSSFWVCWHRIRRACLDQNVLPGGGETEERCAKHLRDSLHNFECFGPTGHHIVQKFAGVLDRFVEQVKSASAQVSDHAVPLQVKDCASSKIEGWTRACATAKLVLQAKIVAFNAAGV